ADLSLAELLPILGRLAFHALAVPMVETAVALALSRRADFLPAGWLYDQPLTLGLMDSQGRLQGLAYGPHCKAALVALGSGHEASLAWLDLPSDGAGLERGGLSPAAQDAAGGAPLAQVAIAMVHRRNLAGEACCDLQCSRAYLDSLPKRSLPHADRWLMQAGALMRSVQMSHAMSKALELSLQFANDRVQFGKPIGKFQAVQHMLAVMASKFNVEPARLLETLKATLMPKATNEELLSFVVTANQYGLNPFTREIYAFPARNGGIQPVVSVDGWIKMMNSHPQFNGIQFTTEDKDGKPFSVTATIHHKDRTHPVEVTEYFSECSRNTEPWKVNPRRMLR
ncbi:MAG: hypothetical protein EBW11_13450, partial [Betaproteobacteria bacterium]|nr:hypothetical protein [Betaproteobacteria bacterium]